MTVIKQIWRDIAIQQAEADKRKIEIDQPIKQLGKQIGKLGNKWHFFGGYVRTWCAALW